MCRDCKVDPDRNDTTTKSEVDFESTLSAGFKWCVKNRGRNGDELGSLVIVHTRSIPWLFNGPCGWN